ncbi:hypothetical protein M0R45_017444 [Rubus argutus]|uniref:Uncharacterized protein n=1 Tax=Rubus argutus TaxID=59490 RepID=A0AAW1XW96_RUBAR
MGKEQLKEAFEKKFSEKLTHILQFDPNIFVEVKKARKILHTGFEVPMGQQRCFMQLLRECDPESELGNRLAQIKDLAAFLGNKLSGYILRMMAVMNAENKKMRMNKFRDFECLFPFLKYAIKWEGETNDFGVVYKRIIVLLKHAHKEFSLVQRSRIPGERRRSRKEECPEISCDRLLNDIVLLISMLESLLSFPLLPDMPRLSTATRTIE